MAAAKTEMLLSALQTSDPLGFPYSPMDSYPKLEELMLLHSAGTTFLAASTPEGVGFGTGETGDSYEHLNGGKGFFNAHPLDPKKYWGLPSAANVNVLLHGSC
uniref:Uncharacterized protein n=1 Tax=Oncorhynchus mykiss TaxID=8022 RepID=A0A8K9WVX3_ONCMY